MMLFVCSDPAQPGNEANGEALTERNATSAIARVDRIIICTGMMISREEEDTTSEDVRYQQPVTRNVFSKQ